MNPIAQIRALTGLSQQQLAQVAGTSQPTIAAYENGRKSPTLKTLERIARASGLEAGVQLVPPMTREDKRSLAFHLAVIAAMEKDPQGVITKARHNLQRLRQLHPGAARLFDEWERWLDLPMASLAQNMREPSLQARDMRQVSPFSGVLSARERTRVLKAFQADQRL